MKRKRPTITISPEAAAEAVKKTNFWKAFEMICIKAGKTKEFFWYVRGRNAEASRDAKKEFIRKMTRLLAYNYDVHRCPAPGMYASLKPAGVDGSAPLRYPPEWKD